MAYQKQGFKDGDKLTAAQLVKMEDGIIGAEQSALSDKQAAASSASAAANSASAAKTSETNAATSASTATSKASAASTSAGNAKTSETNAANSATAAAASATAAQNAASSAFASVEVGSVTAGETASVTNSGSGRDAVLDFVLPRGATGQRGAGIYSVTTAPSSYATEVGGFTPKYRIKLSTAEAQSGAAEIIVGDQIRYSYYTYPIGYVDASYAYMATRVSLRGATGDTGKTAYQYAQDGGYAGTEAEFSEKLANEYSINPLHGKKISLIGDSICAGSSESTSYLGGYGKIIADRNGMEYENLAQAGSTITAETYSSSTGTAKGWISRMVESMSADADYAIVEGGINDAWQYLDHGNIEIGEISSGYNATLDDTTYYGAFESMLKQLVTKFHGKKIGYIAVPKMMDMYDSNRNVPNFYHIALECCAKWGVSVCDLNTIIPPTEYIKTLGTTYTADGTHPTHEGYLKYYCDPIEAWMKTLTTSGNFSAGGGSVEAHNNDASAHSDIRALITALQSGKLNSEGVSFRRAKLPLADGTILEIDVLTALDGTVVIPFVNQVPISVADLNGNIYGVDYNGDGKNDGYKKAYRLSASSGSEKSASDASVIGFIPVKAGDVIRMQYTGTSTKLWNTYSNNTGYNVIAFYDGSLVWLGSMCPVQSSTSVYGICTAADNVTSGSIANGGIVSFTVPSNSNIEYMRISIAMGDNKLALDRLTITVNQEIA